MNIDFIKEKWSSKYIFDEKFKYINDETIKKLNALFNNTQDCIDYIERALNILNSFGFNIKNAIDSLKLQMSH